MVPVLTYLSMIYIIFCLSHGCRASDPLIYDKEGRGLISLRTGNNCSVYAQWALQVFVEVILIKDRKLCYFIMQNKFMK